MKRIAMCALVAALIALASGALAQPVPDEGTPTRLIEGIGLDIWAGATGPEGRIFRGRSRAEFDLLIELERSFMNEIAEDAKQAVFE